MAVLFHDVTERKRRESHARFLDEVGKELARLSDPDEIMQAVGARVGDCLQLSSCAFVDVDQSRGEVTARHAWAVDAARNVGQPFRLEDFLDGKFQRASRAGKTFIVSDTASDPRTNAENYARLKIGAFVSIPFLQAGRWTHCFVATSAAPREWREDEITLLREISERLFARLERAHADEALRASEEKYRTLFDSMDEGYCILQMIHDDAGRACDWRFLQVNRAFEQNSGLRDASGRTIRELAPDIEPKWIEIYDRVACTGEPLRFVEDSAALGRIFNLYAFRIGNSREHRVAVIFTDVTERTQAEERLRLVLENARDYAIFALDPHRRVTSWNPGAERLLGWTEEEILGESADVIFTDEDRRNGEPEKEMQTALAEGRAADERWHVRKDGSRFWGSGVVTKMHDGGGAPIGFVKIFRDQTAELLAKEETERARAEAEAASQAKDHFLAVLSHELRTPLSPILMTVKTLARRADVSDTVRSQLDVIQRNVRMEARLIDDLLDVTRIARGKFEIVHKPFDFHDAIREAMETVQSDVEAKLQALTRALDAAHSHLDGDAARLQQAVWNLLKNASKFTPNGGRIHVATRNTRGWIFLDVSDTGMGIDAQAAPSIFDAFTQGGLSITRQFGGLGLGLAISRAVVEAHNGSIGVKSDGPNRGSTFTIGLPLPTKRGKP